MRLYAPSALSVATGLRAVRVTRVHAEGSAIAAHLSLADEDDLSYVQPPRILWDRHLQSPDRQAVTIDGEKP
jgi:hypothetical protein